MAAALPFGEGTMWPTDFALTELAADDEARIGALVKKEARIGALVKKAVG